ncbi:VOC family protein [Actibacterium sp. D379-3]
MPFIPENPAVWTEIKVTDLAAATDFYRKVFDFELTPDDSGPAPSTVIRYAADGGGVSAQLMPGIPAAPGTGSTIHLCVPDTVEAAMKRLVAAGGTEVSPIITIPPGRFAYAQDPDGNSIGLFQPHTAA